MYQHVMVPLDGSKLAECVLPHLKAIVKGCQAKAVTFVRVLEPLMISSDDSGVALTEEQWQILTKQQRLDADNYLGQVVSQIDYHGTAVHSEVVNGSVAESLSDWAKKNNVDLIIVATHGRSGVSRWVWGSIADRILRSSCVPVFMVRAPGCVPGI